MKQQVKTSWGQYLTIVSEDDLNVKELQAEYDALTASDRSEQAERHLWAAVYTEINRRQGVIDTLARSVGLKPPLGPVAGCKGCESYGEYGPSHWASPLCRSGGRVHCTCDACF